MHITITTLPGYSTQEKILLVRKLKEASAVRLAALPALPSQTLG